MKDLSPETKKLIQRYQKWYRSLEKREQEEETIHVDEVASRVASFYEKIRGVVEWKQEHLFRKTAISRILRRRLLLNKRGDIADSLVRELIRGGHFPNDVLPKSTIQVVQEIIDKYVFILDNAPRQANGRNKSQLQTWLISIAACEIEDVLAPKKEKALIDYMTKVMKKRIKGEGKILQGLNEEEKEIQVFIAVQRSLFKLDKSLISYYLLLNKFPNWKKFSQEERNDVANNIYSLWKEIRKNLNHPLSDKFYKICEKYDAPYLLLGDVLATSPEAPEKINNPNWLEKQIKEAYYKRTKNLKSKLGRAAIYSTLSIFFTNILSLLAFEIPFAKYVMGHFNWLAIGIDVLGPTLLMGLLVVTIRPPGEKNLRLVTMEVMKNVYARDETETYTIRSFHKKSFLMRSMVFLFYILSSLISFGIIIWGLYQINFPPLSYVIFIVFLALIAFAGTRIRERAKELEITRDQETLLQSVIDLFSLPIVRTGKWLSERWEKYNVVALMFSSLIDMPFQTFIEFLEQWRYFLKEKKEEIH